MPYGLTLAGSASITLHPTYGRWVPKEQVGVDGFGHPVYPAVRDYELRWDLISPQDFDQFQGVYDAIQNTGTVVATLPRWGSSTYEYYSYSGCILREPEMGDYFEGHITQAVLLIMNIRT